MSEFLKKMKEKKKLLVVLIIVCVFVVLALLRTFVFNGLDVEYAECYEGSFDDYYTCEGRILGGTDATVYSPVSGKVLEVAVRENDFVEAGDVIAVIDTTNLQYRLDVNGADKTDSQELQKEINRSRIVVKAPESGRIAELPVKKADFVSSGTSLALIYAGGEPYAEADVLINAVPYLKEGDPVTATIVLKGISEQYTGRISEIYDYAKQGVSSIGLKEYRVRVKSLLDRNDTLSQRDGYGVNVKFRLYHSDSCLMIPAGAVYRENGKDFVYVCEDGKAVLKPVSAIYKTAAKYVVSEGLSKGDMVISDAYMNGLTEGVKVSR